MENNFRYRYFKNNDFPFWWKVSHFLHFQYSLNIRYGLMSFFSLSTFRCKRSGYLIFLTYHYLDPCNAYCDCHLNPFWNSKELQYLQFQILLSLVFIQKITKTVSAICFIKIVSCKKKIKVALVRNCHSFKWNNYSSLGKYSAVHFQTTYFVVHIT